MPGGSEPARMLIKDFEERHSGIDTTKLSSDDATVIAKYSITFIMGKGAALVPVLIPKDCGKAMIILAHKKNRTAAGVSRGNLFLFAYTQIMRVCQQISIPVITATAIRHRTSSMLWSIEGLDGSTIEKFIYKTSTPYLHCVSQVGHSVSTQPIFAKVPRCPSPILPKKFLKLLWLV